MTSERIPILVAEDEEMLRMIATEMLEGAGFKVYEAGDGVEALALLKANPQIVLLVSDIRMPRMDGFALVAAGLVLKPDLKVLLMTGYAEEPPPQVLKARHIQILHKPFDLEKLCTVAADMMQ
jgi:two-component system cell cycle sensor histidine kinase/response regulator CckA